MRDEIIKNMVRIRSFESKLLELFSQGHIAGTTHTCIGQEASAVCVYRNFDSQRDVAFSNHRCHGHYLASGGDMRGLLAEIMGKAGGVCGGRGGSQHLCTGSFFSQGVQGQSMPIAAGVAWRKKLLGDGGVVVINIGDGTLGQGVVYESLNIISLLKLPVLVVVEVNGVAQSTDTLMTTAGDIESRFAAFGIATDRRDGKYPVALAEHMENVFQRVRAGEPFVQIIDTFRLKAHSKGDDDRPAEVIAAAEEADYINRLIADDDEVATAAVEAANCEIESLVAELIEAPAASEGEVGVFAQPTEPLFATSDELVYRGDGEMRINALLGEAIADVLQSDEGAMILGEDIADPYGGAFKVTRGLGDKFGGRVFSTPISEAAIVGFASGVALGGGRAIAEIMFGDFVFLAADQLINQAAKMHYMYNGQVCTPIVVRIASGGYRGYGATHSQSPEGFFCQVPGLKVVALSRRHDPAKLLAAAAADPNPVLFVENKLIYSLRPVSEGPAGFEFLPVEARDGGDYPPLVYSSNPGGGAEVTVVAYGGMTDMAERAMEELILSDEVDFEYIVLSRLDGGFSAVADSVERTGRIVTVEEGTGQVGAAVIAKCCQALGQKPIIAKRVFAAPAAIPAAIELEKLILPDVGDICQAIVDTLE